MNIIDDNASALQAIRQYHDSLPANTAEHIKAGLAAGAASFSIVDAAINVGELLYANLDTIDSAGKELCASLIGLASASNWHALGTSGRGPAIVKAVMRELGSDLPWAQQDPADDPEPLAHYCAPLAAPVGDSPLIADDEAAG